MIRFCLCFVLGILFLMRRRPPRSKRTDQHFPYTTLFRSIEVAMEWLRKSGLAKADKKASRIAAEGRIVAAQTTGKAVLVEINCETDFVGKDASFQIGRAHV